MLALTQTCRQIRVDFVAVYMCESTFLISDHMVNENISTFFHDTCATAEKFGAHFILDWNSPRKELTSQGTHLARQNHWATMKNRRKEQ
jgi:hypothetical protein